MKTIIDVYGRELTVNDEAQTLYSYNNSKKEIIYNAEIVENGNATGFYTDYKETGIVTDLEERINVWNSKIKFMYARIVGYDAPNNDPNKEVWNKMIELIKQNEERFFNKNGDYKRDAIVTEEEILDLIVK